MKLSVACNFEPELIDGLRGLPVYELYGKLTQDPFGGGRPSFYLPQVDRQLLKRTVDHAHRAGFEFNYLLNASAMGNLELTRSGQRMLEQMLAWLDDLGVDSVTVASVQLLRLVKRRHPRLKVRISAHRFTRSPRQVRFWAENGADNVVVNEVAIHREFAILRAMQEAARDCGVELQLIVNNWCRQECAIAGNHAVFLSSASQNNQRGYPLDYCSVLCNQIRLNDPVNYLRANWIRPEDLPHYEKLGYQSFKIVERNTPTPWLLMRARAYAERRYDGNLLDLVQNYSYPEEIFSKKAKEAFSLKRMVKYFIKPAKVNLFHFRTLVDFGKTAAVLYPRRGPNPVYIDNRQLDGFLDRFLEHSCADLDCEQCRYCHEWAERVVHIDPTWKAKMADLYQELLGKLDTGTFWESHLATAAGIAGRWLRRTSRFWA
jgi:collagenase-like PrtC family protease